MSHQELIDDFGELADKHGVMWTYWPDSRKVQGHKGFPDLILCGEYHCIFREVKDWNDYLRPDQVKWNYRLKGANINIKLWTPRDLKDGSAEREIMDLNIR